MSNHGFTILWSIIMQRWKHCLIYCCHLFIHMHMVHMYKLFQWELRKIKKCWCLWEPSRTREAKGWHATSSWWSYHSIIGYHLMIYSLNQAVILRTMFLLSVEVCVHVQPSKCICMPRQAFWWKDKKITSCGSSNFSFTFLLITFGGPTINSYPSLRLKYKMI